MLGEGKITVDDAERLLDALSGAAPSDGPAAGTGRSKYKYLRIVVEGGPDKERVNVRVPLALIRAGIKLGSLLPDKARGHVSVALRKKGINFDIDKLDPKRVDEFLEALTELTINADGAKGGETIRVFCE
jgi:hypothetical protein